MSFVVQQPNSLTNDSDRYRVTEVNDWLRYRNGATTSYAFTSFTTYEEAVEARDKANESVVPRERDWDNEDDEKIFETELSE